MIEAINGEGTIEASIPAMLRLFYQYGIDMRKVPVPVYPTLHYQNGGVEIDAKCFSKTIDNLLCAGEVTGGVHGRNRLMGNSLLDVIVFGRDAGMSAAEKAKSVKLGNMTLNHVTEYAQALQSAGEHTNDVSPMLLPKYARHAREFEWRGFRYA